MYFLRERKAAKRSNLISEDLISRVLVLDTDPVPANELIDLDNVRFSQNLVHPDGVMNLYLNAPGGAVQINGGSLGAQTIQSVEIPAEDLKYISSIINLLDSIIELDFAFVESSINANTAFYYDQEIDIGDGGNTLGLAVPGSMGWEIFANYSQLADDPDYRQYAVLHEFGHALGLEHPFEDRDGDVFDGNTDPWTSAFPEQTVMAYRYPKTGDWPDFFTANDLNALIEIWGTESQELETSNNTFTSSDLGGKVRKSRGNDRLTGYSMNDVFSGGNGSDWMKGGIGNDIITGGPGADYFRIAQGNDLITDFSVIEGDKLQIESGMPFSLTVVNGSVQIETILGITTLDNFSDEIAASASISFL